jgi:Tol biopolymer transport system component
MNGTTAGRTGHRLAIALAATTSMLVVASPAATATDQGGTSKAGTITRASVATDGSQARGGSYPSVRGGLSGDGTHVAFATGASNLVKNDTNAASDAFVRDLATGKTRRVSVSSTGRQANGGSSNASISYSGNHVVFESVATNLGGTDTRDNVDVFVRNLVTKATRRVSVSRTGKQTNGDNFFPVVSRNGKYVAFQSSSSNLVKGDTNGHEDVFVRNMRNGKTTRVSLKPNGKQFKGISLEPSISSNGRYVLFAMTRDGDGLADLYVRDRLAKTTRKVFSEASFGHAIVGSWTISANGRYVAMMTDGGLVTDDTNGEFDAYRIDVASGALVRTSVTSDGSQAGGVTGRVAISGDGNCVAFSTFFDGYVADDSGEISDVFVRDISAATTFKVSVDPTGAQGNDHSGFQGYLALSRHGDAVSFESGASNLVARDTNGGSDVFVWRAG